MIVYTGFSYVTSKNVVDIGKVQIDRDVNHNFQWSPLLGGILLAGGVIVILSAKKSKV